MFLLRRFGDYKDDEEDRSEDLVQIPVDCVVQNALVMKPEGTGPLSRIKNVGSYAECEQKCLENPQCESWSWKGFKNRPKCLLFAKITNLKFKKRNGGVAGKVVDNCAQPKEVETSQDFCVEYGALYGGQSIKIRTIKGTASPEDCKQECLSQTDCVRYSWKGSKRNKINQRRRNRRKQKQKCILFREGQHNILTKKKFVSGSVTGKCTELSLEDMSTCFCSQIKPSENLRFSFDPEDLEDNDEDFNLAETLSPKLSAINQVSCPRNNVKRCTGNPSQPLIQRGDYCVDYHIFYEEGDEIETLENVFSADECKAYCERDPRCQFYSWFVSTCSLKSADNWEPVYEDGAVSGSVKGDCRDKSYNELGFCECQLFEYDDYEEVDLVGLGLIDVKSLSGGNTKDGCPEEHGKRCFVAKKAGAPIKRANIPDPTSVRFGIS